MTKGRKAVSIILSVVMIITSLFTVSSFAGEKKEEKSESYIVVYEEDTSNREIREDVKGDVIDITKTDDSKIALIEPEGKDIRDLKEDSSVKYIQPNYEYHTLGNDPYMSKENAVNYQYFHENVESEAAWDILEQGEHGRTIVGVIDTGADVKHEDLKKNLITNSDGTYKMFAYGKESNVKGDADEHGTHVSGIVGATYGNGKGGSGVAVTEMIWSVYFRHPYPIHSRHTTYYWP